MTNGEGHRRWHPNSEQKAAFEFVSEVIAEEWLAQLAVRRADFETPDGIKGVAILIADAVFEHCVVQRHAEDDQG
jgi:hypothetical protein